VRIRTKITATTSIALAIVAFGFGTVAVLAGASSNLQQIDNDLNLLALNSSLSSDPVGAALLKLDSVGPQTEVGFYSINQDYTVLGDQDSIVTSTPPLPELRAASKMPITIAQSFGRDFRLRTVSLPDGEYVVFASSLLESNQATIRNIWLLVSASSLSIVAGIILVRLLTNRDLKRIGSLIVDAKRIGEGNFNVQLEKTEGTSEIDVLNNSLVSMVDSLQQALQSERVNHQKMQDFIADSSHELRTPIALIRGYVELMFNENVVDEEVLDRSKLRLNEQLIRMQDLVNSLLLLAEIGQTLDPEIEHLCLSGSAGTAIEDLRVLHSTMTINTKLEANVYVEMNREHLHKVLYNIVSNLSRYVPADQRVDFTLRTDGGVAKLQVDDSGPGLPEEAYRDGIRHFNRFAQNRTKSVGGTGLGLTIMVAIVQKYGGTVDFMKSPLGGLRTQILIPLAAT
jgi:two-component system OmpR family sensor kinase